MLVVQKLCWSIFYSISPLAWAIAVANLPGVHIYRNSLTLCSDGWFEHTEHSDHWAGKAIQLFVQSNILKACEKPLACFVKQKCALHKKRLLGLQTNVSGMGGTVITDVKQYAATFPMQHMAGKEILVFPKLDSKLNRVSVLVRLFTD